MIQEEFYVRSTIDGTMQPNLFYRASEENRPLLVGLHTWSYDRFNQIDYLLPLAEEQNFNLLLPEFRGPNLTTNPNKTLACGSLHAKQDIKDAIDHIKEHERIDADNIFLVGLSGGGHMAMLMAGYCPEYFRAVAPFVPISDVRKWKNPDYIKQIDYCCDGSEEIMYERSPMKYIDTISRANMKIFHGKYDNSVPVTQSIEFFNEMMARYPKSRIFLDVFDGGHQFELDLCRKWLLSQYKKPLLAEVTG